MIVHRRAVKAYWVPGPEGRGIRRLMLDQKMSRKYRKDVHNPPCGLPGTRKARRALMFHK